MHSTKQRTRRCIFARETCEYIVFPTIITFSLSLIMIAVGFLLGELFTINNFRFLIVVAIVILILTMLLLIIIQHRRAHTKMKMKIEHELSQLENAMLIAGYDIHFRNELNKVIIGISNYCCDLHIKVKKKSRCPITLDKRKEHIERILKLLWEFVCESSDFSPTEHAISITLVYKKIDDATRKEKGRRSSLWEKGWHLLHYNYKSKLTANEMASSETAGGLELLVKDTNNILYHDKNDMLVYHEHNRDVEMSNDGKTGSFFGYRMDIQNSNRQLDVVAMLFINTFGRMICKLDNDVAERKSIENNYLGMVFPLFIPRLQKELSIMQIPFDSPDDKI